MRNLDTLNLVNGRGIAPSAISGVNGKVFVNVSEIPHDATAASTFGNLYIVDRFTNLGETRIKALNFTTNYDVPLGRFPTSVRVAPAFTHNLMRATRPVVRTRARPHGPPKTAPMSGRMAPSGG